MGLFSRRKRQDTSAEQAQDVAVARRKRERAARQPAGVSVSLGEGAVADIAAAESALREVIASRLVKPRTTANSLMSACQSAVSPHLSGDGLWKKVQLRYQALSAQLTERGLSATSQQQRLAAKEIRGYANDVSRTFAADAAAEAFERHKIDTEDGEPNARFVARAVAKDWAERVQRLAIGVLAAHVVALGASLSAHKVNSNT